MTAVTDYIEGRFVVAGTGSRFYDPAVDQETARRLDSEMAKSLEKHPDLVVMSGGAQGWDQELTEVADHLGIPYVLCIPNKGYGAYYWQDDPEWKYMLEHAAAVEYTIEDVHGLTGIYKDGKHSNFVRNDRMVELANAFWIFDGGSPGTAQCVRSIRVAGKPHRFL